MEMFLLKPAVKNYLWGGSRLHSRYGISTGDKPVAEAWMLSCHPDGRCRISGGEFDGCTLPELLTKHPNYMGTHARDFRMFPVMIKLIDAAQSTSVQVHPDDDYVEGREQGKGELWYIIDCDEDSEIIYGFSDEITQDKLMRCLQEGTFVEELNRVPVKKGDVFYLEAGTVHAVGKGVLLAEVQENSNLAYRMFDYGRLDQDGEPRALHIAEAVDVAITAPPTVEPGASGEPVRLGGMTSTELCACEYFTASLLEVDHSGTVEVDDTSFAALLSVEGEVTLQTSDDELELGAGECVFIPAGAGTVTLRGKGKIICTTI